MKSKSKGKKSNGIIAQSKRHNEVMNKMAHEYLDTFADGTNPFEKLSNEDLMDFHPAPEFQLLERKYLALKARLSEIAKDGESPEETLDRLIRVYKSIDKTFSRI